VTVNLRGGVRLRPSWAGRLGGTSLPPTFLARFSSSSFSSRRRGASWGQLLGRRFQTARASCSARFLASRRRPCGRLPHLALFGGDTLGAHLLFFAGLALGFLLGVAARLVSETRASARQRRARLFLIRKLAQDHAARAGAAAALPHQPWRPAPGARGCGRLVRALGGRLAVAAGGRRNAFSPPHAWCGMAEALLDGGCFVFFSDSVLPGAWFRRYRS